MGRYGVTANAIAPSARTRMTEEVFGERMKAPAVGLRRQRSREHLAARRVARQRGVARRHGPRVRGRGRPDLGRRRLAARPAGRQGRALGAGRGRRGRARAARARRPHPRRCTARSSSAPGSSRAARRAGALAARAASGPTRRCSTGSRRPPARTSRSSTATTRLTIDELRGPLRSSGGARCTRCGVRAGRRRVLAAPELVGSGRVLSWAIWRCGAIASPITPTLRAREVGFILRQTGARLLVVPHEFRGTDYVALARDAGYDGDVLVVRGDDPLPEAASSRARRRVASTTRP